MSVLMGSWEEFGSRTRSCGGVVLLLVFLVVVVVVGGGWRCNDNVDVVDDEGDLLEGRRLSAVARAEG